MRIIRHSVETSATKEAVWEIWKDVANWNSWDPGIEYSSLNGPFAAGTTGTLKPKNGPLVHTKLTAVEPYQMFTDEAKLPMARIIVTHTMSESGDKTVVTHDIQMKGPMAFFFSFLIGRDMKKNLPHEMQAMVKKAENLCLLAK